MAAVMARPEVWWITLKEFTEGELSKHIFRETDRGKKSKNLQDEQAGMSSKPRCRDLSLVLCTAPVQAMLMLPILKSLVAWGFGESILEGAVLAGSADFSVRNPTVSNVEHQGTGCCGLLIALRMSH